MNVIKLLLFLLTLSCLVSGEEIAARILALYDPLAPAGESQHFGYQLAVEQSGLSAELEVTYRASQVEC